MRVRPLASAGACLVTVATLASAAGLAPAQAVTTDQSYWMPVGKQVTVRGHGFGHGHGMSQYGARGAALQGLGYRKIVDFYYPGTTWGEVTGKVRVLITADTTRDLVVSPQTGLTLRDLGDGRTYALPEVDGATRWRLNVDAEGRTVVGYLTKSWHRWSPGGKTSLAGDGELTAAKPLTLWTPSGSRRYRGALRAASPSAGSSERDTVNVLSMDDYLKGVVPREMPASWATEAVRAQAVAARTYAAWSRAQNSKRYYQICDTISCQVYGGVDDENSLSNAAITATARQILTFKGAPAFTQFSASSGGWTSAGSVPYLAAQADPYDGADGNGNVVHEWTTTIDVAAIERAYPSLGRLERIRVVSRDGNGEWQGRVWSLVLDGSEADRTLSGDAFRSMFGLRSTWFTLEPTPIIARWASLGGDRSVVGEARAAETAAGSGTVQRFAKGRMFWSPSTGAHALYGPVLTAYLGLGGPKSRLRLPVTGVQKRDGGVRAKFERGLVFSSRHGTVPVLGKPISERYLELGGLTSRLGWPTRTNRATATGERVDFQHGWIGWNRETGATRVRVTS